MTGEDQSHRWLRDALASLASARSAVAAGDARTGCMHAQLAVELSAKAIISRFAEPQWTHRPSPQLRDLLERGDDEIETLLGPGARAAVDRLANDVDHTAVWHGWATYGRKDPDGAYRAAVDVCTPEAAADLLARAEHAVLLARRTRVPPGDAPREGNPSRS